MPINVTIPSPRTKPDSVNWLRQPMERSCIIGKLSSNCQGPENGLEGSCCSISGRQCHVTWFGPSFLLVEQQRNGNSPFMGSLGHILVLAVIATDNSAHPFSRLIRALVRIVCSGGHWLSKLNVRCFSQPCYRMILLMKMLAFQLAACAWKAHALQWSSDASHPGNFWKVI